MIKRNIRDYRKERKEKQYKNKTKSRIKGIIQKMYVDGTTEEVLSIIICMIQAMEDASDDEDYDSDDTMSQHDVRR